MSRGSLTHQGRSAGFSARALKKPYLPGGCGNFELNNCKSLIIYFILISTPLFQDEEYFAQPDLFDIQSPQWASWDYKKRHLPITFHTLKGFQQDLESLESLPLHCRITVILGVGLGYRDIMTVVESEEDSGMDVAESIRSSELEAPHAEALM